VTNPGYITPPTTGVTYYFTPRDAFRTPTVYQTDVSLNYSKTIGPVEIFISPQVLNLLNAAHALSVDTTTLSALSTGGGNNRFVAFNPFTQTPTLRPADQRPTNTSTGNTTSNWDYGPNFGKAVSYYSPSAAPTTTTYFQLPRTFRVSMGVRF